LARGANLKSPMGAYLDDMAHYLFHTPFLLSFAYYLWSIGRLYFAGFVILFAVIDNLYRAELDLVERVRPDSDDGIEAVVRSRSIVSVAKSMILGSFNFPNVLVWMTLLCWNLDAMEVYFIYATSMSLLYYFYTFTKTVKRGLAVR